MPLIAAATACSTGPDFKPSVPLEKAANEDEAARICAAVPLPAGQDLKNSLAPWVACAQEALMRFPALGEREELVMMYRSLRLRHGQSGAGEPLDERGRYVQLMEKVTDNAFSGKGPLCDRALREFARRQVPALADYWEGRCAGGKGALARGSTITQEALEKEIGDLAQDALFVTNGTLAAGPTDRAPTVSHGTEARSFCRQFIEYAQALTQLRGLVEYKAFMASGRGGGDAALRARLDERIGAFKVQALGLREKALALEGAAQVQRTSCFFQGKARPKARKTRRPRRQRPKRGDG